MNQTIAVFNFKGGVGKTTSTLNLAHHWSENFRVLVIDSDPQCNLTNTLLPHRQYKNTIYHYIKNYLHNNMLDVETVKVKKGLDIIPGDYDLTALDSNSQFIEFGTLILQRLLQSLRTDYDLILIDCPTYFGKTVKFMLNNSDQVLVPVTPDLFSIRGALKIIKFVREIEGPKKVNILGIYFNRFRARLLYHQKIRLLARRLFSTLLVERVIRNTIKIAETSDRNSEKSTSFDIAPDFAALGFSLEKRLIRFSRKTKIELREMITPSPARKEFQAFN